MFKFLNIKKFTFIIFYFITIIILTFPTQFQVILPGDITSFDQQISIADHELSDISSIYVISYEPITLFQYTVIDIFQKGQLFIPNATTQAMTVKEKYDAAQLQKLSSYMLSTIVAYEKAEKVINYTFEGYAVTSLFDQSRHIIIGDYITSINGVTLNINTDFTQFRYASILHFELIRNNEKIEVTHIRSETDYPLSLYPIYAITYTEPKISFPGLDSFIGGPSGGMMMTLSIYLSLMSTSYDLSIVGTGTIQFDGSIGNIGGLNEKYETVKDRMDIMFIPMDQHDILKHTNDHRIIPIKHIDDAILYLSEYYG